MPTRSSPTAVARRAGGRPSARRYYESMGLLPAAAAVLPRLALIAAAQQMGVTIAEIGTLLHGVSPDTSAAARWRVLAARKLPEVEALMARAQGMARLLEEALACGCLPLDACARTLPTCAQPDGECAVAAHSAEAARPIDAYSAGHAALFVPASAASAVPSSHSRPGRAVPPGTGTSTSPALHRRLALLPGSSSTRRSR